MRFLAIAVFALLFLLAGRAIQLAFSGDPLARESAAHARLEIARADITDRNGVLLATTVRAYALTATPSRVWDAEETARVLMRLFPDLNRADTVRRLTDRERDVVYLRRGLTPAQREAVLTLGLGGIGFETEDRRVYPQGAMAAHALGFTDVDLNPLAGVERGLDAQIREAGAAGRPLALSLDVRLQYALETELDAAARAAGASGASAILLDARSGETLALASWPSFDPNNAGAAPAAARQDRVAGDLHELGSTIKPFTVAMALDEDVTNSAETFDVSRPFEIAGGLIEDHERIEGLASLRTILARSSNIGAARLALRLGAARQRTYLDRLGLLAPTGLEIGRNQAPLAPQAQGRRDVAGIGFGYGLATTQAALASAYTVFANEGARVRPTLLRRAPEDEVERTQVFSPQTTRQVLSYLRYSVTDGTGRAADVRGLQVAGKTGTAEKLGAGASYDESRNFSSFAGVFPASNPRYVIVVSLDDVQAGQVGGAVAAPVVARVLTRAAPMLGLRVEPRDER
ncbi:MAG: penicillin-binding protein 2 [Hyphomonadaceae bacterium]|nr:penicillin-binding protein 2 [Hyphomonadaceae bacterium]